jgi:hypothetical protein
MPSHIQEASSYIRWELPGKEYTPSLQLLAFVVRPLKLIILSASPVMLRVR